jgi:hypothetical protein
VKEEFFPTMLSSQNLASSPYGECPRLKKSTFIFKIPFQKGESEAFTFT